MEETTRVAVSPARGSEPEGAVPGGVFVLAGCMQGSCPPAEVTSTAATKPGAEFPVQKSVFVTEIMQINTSIAFPSLFHAQST